ncbi:hypothetical protein D047_4646A, partial [Vibrio parahaemolyticus VPTS-2010_2]
MVMGTV